VELLTSKLEMTIARSAAPNPAWDFAPMSRPAIAVRAIASQRCDGIV
jgi:hypothetical protein